DWSSDVCSSDLEHQLSDGLSLFGQLIYGKSVTNSPAFTSLMFGPWQATLFADNAFLPESVRTLMAEVGLSSVGFSRLASTRDLGVARFEQEHKTMSVTEVVRAEHTGSGIFDVWELDSYYILGHNENRIREVNFPRVVRIFIAMDSVLAPDGSIVCRAALFDPATFGDCVP